MTAYFVLIGKKTSSSMVYMSCYDLIKYFKILPKLSRKKYDSTIHNLVKEGFLIQDNDWVQITTKGQNYLQKNKLELQNINGWRYSKIQRDFWLLLLLVIQVFSEVQYKERFYAPITNSIKIQKQFKQFLYRENFNYQEIITNFSVELLTFIKQLPEIAQKILLFQVTGHGMYGKTIKQLAEELQQDEFQVYLIMLDTLHLLIHQIQRKKYPMMAKIFDVQPKNSYLVEQTLNLINNGFETIEDLSGRLKRRPGTIIDYLLELGLNKQIDLRKYLSKEAEFLFDEYQTVDSNIGSWNYKDLEKHGYKFAFFEFRIYQLTKGLEIHGT